MHRVCVVGCSGSGKTTFAALLAHKLGLPHLELDSIYHQSEWTSLPNCRVPSSRRRVHYPE